MRPLLLILFCALLAAPSFGRPAVRFSGTVVDAASGEPIPGATVRLLGANTFAVTDSEGHFAFDPLPAGLLGLQVRHVGYQVHMVELPELENDTRLTVRLNPVALQLDPVILEQALDEGDTTFTRDPALALGGSSLQQELGGTLAETLAEEPGISQRTLGPAPARPVLRGMGGDRLRILENGRETGDLSASTSDHAVAIDPATAHEITVFRGPETVLYGPATPGGVIDVERTVAIDDREEHAHARFTTQHETVNAAWVGGGDITAPVGEFALHVDGGVRQASALRTPDATLANTDLRGHNLTASAAWLPEYGATGIGPVAIGAMGVGATTYESAYGIPGGFFGGHTNGVDIEMQRRRYDARARIDLRHGPVHDVTVDLSRADYTHSEFEASGRLGMRFDVTLDAVRAVGRLGSVLGFDAGAVGIDLSRRDAETGGLTFTPDAIEESGGLFVYARRHTRPWTWRIGLRGDARTITPDRERTSIVIGRIEERQFAGLSGSVAVIRVLARDVEAHVSLTRAWRAPRIEELYSEGPHLAAYSYEVGNPTLDAEASWAAEFGITHTRSRFSQRFTVFGTVFDAYLQPRNTGHPSARRNDLIEYRYEGVRALFAGAETTMDIALSDEWTLGGSGSFVVAEDRDDSRPLERIPPLNGRLALTWHPDMWTLTVRSVGSSRQWRVGEFETSTSAWLRFDLLAGIEWPWAGTLHAATLSITNLTDAAYRNHLSRIKSVLPEPGRNVSVVWRVYL